MSDSRIYFPLRSNAPSLLSGAPIAAVRKRIKIAALLYDHVMLEDGRWSAQMGPTGNARFWHPVPDDEPISWQTPLDRGRSKGKEFHVLMAPENSSGIAAQGRPIVRSQTSESFMATFEPFKNELPEAYPWLLFGHVPDDPQHKSQLKRFIREDLADPAMVAAYPERFVRSAIVEDLTLDLAVGMRLQAAVASSPQYEAVTLLRLQNGRATRIPGDFGLATVLPDVGNLDWFDIHEARRHPGIIDFRRIIAEVEQTAWDTSDSVEDAERYIKREYRHHLDQAIERVASDIRGRVMRRVISIVAGQFAGLLATAVTGNGIAGAATGEIAAGGVDAALTSRATSQWLSAHEDLNRRLRLTRISDYHSSKREGTE